MSYHCLLPQIIHSSTFQALMLVIMNMMVSDARSLVEGRAWLVVVVVVVVVVQQ